MFLFKRSNGFYYLYYTDNNKRKVVTTKHKDIRGAREFLKYFIKTDNKQVTPVIYLQNLEIEVIKYVTDNLSKSSVNLYKVTFKNIKSILGNKPIKNYSARDIEHYKANRILTVSKTSCNIELRVMQSLFNLAIKWGLLDVNPLSYVSKFPNAEKKPLAFSHSEIETIYRVIDKPYLREIVRFSLLTGCRINETLNIQYKEIDLKDRVLNIMNKETFKTKSRKNRFLPISDSLFEFLSDIMNNGNIIDINHNETYLFNRKGFRYTPDFISKLFKKALRDAGFDEKFHFHCLRHTYISNLVKAGVNIRYIQQLAGHSDIKTTERYVHININELRSAVNLIK